MIINSVNIMQQIKPKYLGYFSLFFLLFCSQFIQAQDVPERLKDRVDAMKVAYLTEKINLTTEQAQHFWPVYNEYQKEQKSLRVKYRAGRPLTTLTDAELEKQLDSNFELEAALLKLKRSYYEQMKTIINIRQIAQLNQAEREFNKEIIKKMLEFRERRQIRRKN